MRLQEKLAIILSYNPKFYFTFVRKFIKFIFKVVIYNSIKYLHLYEEFYLKL